MTLTLDEKFEKAYKFVQSQPKEGPFQPSQDRKLEYYKYYKQATEGDVSTARPGMFDFVGKAKWDAHKSVEGVSKEEAKKKYIELLLADLEQIADKSGLEQVIADLKA
ncbi:Acbp from Moniliophthora Perniciosa [Pisolithus orientalis]|uniref:Acbp from Moniliophthora Perniciosa n=1 Tax=Pisolithus orientalis TaxID=936130 RepID=UPI00222519F9|nr:Acbp from Moniliophthora Perniciosa [Pisolithus orientalis]KAI6025892.1 Acbp from Moniliophthora Perniciosa [Pisolithus orientalis]